MLAPSQDAQRMSLTFLELSLRLIQLSLDAEIAVDDSRITVKLPVIAIIPRWKLHLDDTVSHCIGH